MQQKWGVLSGLVLIVLFLSSCSVNPVSGKKDFTLISQDQELAMGAQAHQTVLKKMKKYDDPGLQAYVNSIGQQLARNSHRKDIKYTFTVLDDPSVNAFALPGGYIYVTTGILAYLNSEGELAGVLGHEIGHVTARHSVKQQSAGIAGSLLISVLSKEVGASAGDSLNQLGTALIRGYGREHELQSDQLGAEYLALAGYAPENMIDVVSVLKSQEEFEKYQAKKEGRQPQAYHGVFATHPENDTRLQEVIKAAKRFKSAGERSANRDAYLQRINGLKYKIDKDHSGRIVVGRTPATGENFAVLARTSKVDEQRLRLLNGMFPDGQPQQGQLIKVIQ